MTKEEWSAQLTSLFPSEINGIVRPTEGIPTDLDFSTNFPQFISQDPARYDSWNAFLRQLFSNDALFQKWITELQTAIANQDFSLATQQIKGLMSVSDKIKLDGIAAGAELNQNAFSTVNGIAANNKTDTLNIVAGANVTITPDNANKKITVTSKDTTYDIVSTTAAGLVPKRDGSTTKFLCSDGTWATAQTTSGVIPVGGIIMWSGTTTNIPANWTLCDGTNNTPNLLDKMVVGAGSAYAVGATGGEATHTLTTTEIPRHNHGITVALNEASSGYCTVGSGVSGTYYTDYAGGGDAHNNMPPYYALAFIMRIA